MDKGRRRRRSSVSSRRSSVSHSRSIKSRSHSLDLSQIECIDASDTMLNKEEEISNNESVIEQDFAGLRDQIINGIGEFESALNEFIEWKNGMIENNIPSNLKLEVTLLFARLFRRYYLLLVILYISIL